MASSLSFKNWSIRSKTIVPIVLIGVALCVATYYLVDYAQQKIVTSQASKAAAYIANQINADRKFYTQEVVDRLRRDGVVTTAVSLDQLGNEKGSIPLPASFVHATSKLVNDQGLHMVDLLSLWRINPNKGPRTAQERLALEQLVLNPREAVQWVAQDSLGSPRFYRVTADIASAEACVTCHNLDPHSPRKDFRLNDVMGGLLVSLPLKEEFALAEHNTVLWTAVVSGVFALLIFTMVFVQSRYVTQPINELEALAEKISLGEVNVVVAVDSNDEIGRLAKAFDRMRESVKKAMERLAKRS